MTWIAHDHSLGVARGVIAPVPGGPIEPGPGPYALGGVKPDPVNATTQTNASGSVLALRVPLGPPFAAARRLSLNARSQSWKRISFASMPVTVPPFCVIEAITCCRVFVGVRSGGAGL